MRKTRQFYIPNVSFWKWNLVSPSYVRVQLARAKESYRETDNAIANLELDLKQIEQEILAKWATANVQMMRGFEDRLKAVRAENKRIAYVRLKLREVIDRMTAHLEHSV